MLGRSVMTECASSLVICTVTSPSYLQTKKLFTVQVHNVQNDRVYCKGLF